MQSASIVAIGTEITDGQIVDRNSAWISKKLEAMGLRPKFHLSVSDTHEEVLTALEFARQHSQYIFVCGGLGPTSDDRTRDMVANHTGLELLLDEPSWEEIKEKLQTRGVTLRDGHKRQAMLPKTAAPLKNTDGVAPGFYLEQEQTHYWAVPGPPKELASVWTNSIQTQLQTLMPQENHRQLHKWVCWGIAESELAHLTEEHFNKYSFEKEHGYRLHTPYIEVKLWLKETTTESQKAMKEYKQIIAQHYLTSELNKIRQDFLDSLENYDNVVITDDFSQGLYYERLKEIFQGQKAICLKYTTHLSGQSPSPKVTTGDGLSIHIHNRIENEVKIELTGVNNRPTSFTITLRSPRSNRYNKFYVLESLILQMIKLKKSL